MQQIQIGNENLNATFISYGARIVDIRMAENDLPLILGFPDITDYLKDTAYLGAIVGRVANRIAFGKTRIGSNFFEFDKNENAIQTLHGGAKSCAFQNWQIEQNNNMSVTFTLSEPHGHMGFPGNCHLKVKYEIIPPMCLKITMRAISDKDSIFNLVSHPYFCLDNSSNISAHELQIHAKHYLPVNNLSIPTGKINPVSNSRFDFLRPRKLTQIVAGRDEPIDHNFCLSKTQTTLREVATLSSSLSNITMTISSTEPGLQFYTGHNLSATPDGYGKRPYTPFSGLCLEPQAWPDAPNQHGFPSIFLPANTPYQQISCFEFSVRSYL